MNAVANAYENSLLAKERVKTEKNQFGECYYLLVKLYSICQANQIFKAFVLRVE